MRLTCALRPCLLQGVMLNPFHPPVSCAALTAAAFKWGRTSRRGAADHQGNALMLPSAVACAEEVADFFGAGVPLPSL